MSVAFPFTLFVRDYMVFADFNWFESNAFIADPILIFVFRMNPSNPIILFSLFRHPRGIRHMNSPHADLANQVHFFHLTGNGQLLYNI